MSYAVVGGTGGRNPQSKKSIPQHLGTGGMTTWEVNHGGYPVRPGQPDCSFFMRTGICSFGAKCKFNHPPSHALTTSTSHLSSQGLCMQFLRTGICSYGRACKYTHEQIHATGMKAGHSLPPFQPGQAPPSRIEENVQKQQGTIGGSNSTGTAGVPIPSCGIDVSELLSKAIHVPDFSTIVSKCTGSLHTPEIEQPPMFQSVAAKAELKPLDEKMPLQEQPSTNPDALLQQQSEQQQQHQQPPRDSYQHHPLQPQGGHPIQEKSQPIQEQQEQATLQQQTTCIEWTPPPHLLQEPRVSLQNQQQPLSNWEGTTPTPSQPLRPSQPQWVMVNVASQQQHPQLNDAKEQQHLIDERNQQENVGWGSRTSTREILELTYHNGSSHPPGRSEHHQQQQQQLQSPAPLMWGNQSSHRMASHQHPQQPPHRPIEPTTEQWPSSQPPVPPPSVVHVRHLLVKHCGSRNPTSLKDPTGEKIRQRSIEEAVETLRRLRVEAMGGNETTFANLASQWSDCNSSKRGGDLGSFGRGKMQPPFEDVAFELPVGRVSDVVLTNSGAHIIYRVS